MSSLAHLWHGSPATWLALHRTCSSSVGGLVFGQGELTLELRQLTHATLRLVRSSLPAGVGAILMASEFGDTAWTSVADVFLLPLIPSIGHVSALGLTRLRKRHLVYYQTSSS